MTKNLFIPLVLLSLAGCEGAVPGREALGDVDAGVCENAWETPLQTVDGGEAAGKVAIEIGLDEVRVEVWATPGWELGDGYLGVGQGGAAPVWVAVNPTPWIDGWVTHLTLVFPLTTAECGEVLKVLVQVNVRRVGEAGHELASAVGNEDRYQWGWAEHRPICCEPPPEGCTLTQGYWKNHEEAWPVDSLVLGEHEYTQAELLTLLRTPVRGDASISLAHQLIAALLNVASGASSDPAIAEAQEWLSDNGGVLPFGIAPSSPAGAEAVALNEALTDFNEGNAGPPHCDDN